ncbi:MAG TPA: hypothetical protein DCM33_01150, partial [Acinetobacter radioresistens]|nr:hypothetical protein [Acinetobacter radioresistens]
IAVLIPVILYDYCWANVGYPIPVHIKGFLNCCAGYSCSSLKPAELFYRLVRLNLNTQPSRFYK